MLKINNCSKSFEKHKVLDGLNLFVKDSSIFGLVGVNGSGKTTLLRAIAGVYEIEEGEILFDDRNTFTDDLIRKDIVYISDDPYFPMAATLLSMKEFYTSFYNFDEAEYRKYLNIFKLNEKQQLSSFSKGMKRQAMLIFAFAIKPKLLLLDEAFDGLDPLVRHEVKLALSDFIEDSTSSIIISSHNLKELDDICDSYGILENGQINTYGDLLESEANINKYQLAFKEEIDDSYFDRFNVLSKTKEGSIIQLVIKGNREETVEKLNLLNPLILDVLPVNFEELFIYEHKGGMKNV